MKNLRFLTAILVLLVSSFSVTGQVKISQMSAYTSSPDSIYIPVLVNGVNKRIVYSTLDINTGFVDDITALISFVRGSKKSVIVKDAARGGRFNWYVSLPSGYTVDNGMSFNASGGGYWVRDISQSNRINVKWFGAKGDGTTDDHDAIITANNFSTGKTLYFSSGKYFTSSIIQCNLINATWVGEDSLTTILGSFGVGIVQFTTLRNSVVNNMGFRSDYVTAIDAGSPAVVFTDAIDVQNAKFINCRFKAPAANTEGLVLRANITSPVTTHFIRDVEISDCLFDSIGSIGVTIMNRNYNAGGSLLARRIKFNHNIGRNLGLSGSFGFLISLDGVGEETEVNNNQIYNALGIGIENTGWNNSDFKGNVFSDFQRDYAPFSFSDRVKNNNVVSDNKTIGKARSNSIFNGMTNSAFTNNSFQSIYISGCTFVNIKKSAFSNNNFYCDTSYGIFLRNVDTCTFTNENYTGEFYGLYVEAQTDSVSNNNIFDNCIFSTKFSLLNHSVVRFINAGVTGNMVKGCLLLKGATGAYVDEQSSASGNIGQINFHDGTLATYNTNFTFAQYGITAGYASSVSNSDGSLNISPTTLAVVASLNTAHINNWSALQSFTNGSAVISNTSTTAFTTALLELKHTANTAANQKIDIFTQHNTSGSGGAGEFIIRHVNADGAGSNLDVLDYSMDSVLGNLNLKSPSIITFRTGNNSLTTSERFRIYGNGDVTIGATGDHSFKFEVGGTTRINDKLTLATGTTSISPLNIPAGTLVSSPATGNVENDGTDFYQTQGTTRYKFDKSLSGSATLDFTSTAAQNSADLTITVTGAASGDAVFLGVPNGSVLSNSSFSAWVSATNTVTVRFNNYSSGALDPASGTFKVRVVQ